MSSLSNGLMPIPEAPPKPTPGFGRRFWAFPVTRIVVFLLLLLALGLALGLPLALVLRAAHVPVVQGTEIGALLAEGVFAAAAVGAFLLMVRFADKRSAASAGLMRRGLALETGLGLLGGALLFSLVIGALAALGAYHVNGINPHARFLVPLLLFLLVAVSEEIVFRGYIFQTLEGRWGTGIALVVSALLFGLIHLTNPISGLTLGQKLVGPLFLVIEASIPMTAAFLLTRRMWLPIGIHWGWNLFESAVYGSADSGLPATPLYTLLQSRLSGPFPVTGGAFGPEASVVCFVISTAAGLFLLRQAIRRGQWRPRIRSQNSHLSLNLEVIQ